MSNDVITPVHVGHSARSPYAWIALPSAPRGTPLTAIALPSFALYVASRGALRVPPHALFCLLLYPLWGLIQQVLVLVGALVFGAVHLPALLLTVGTTLLALLYVPQFLRDRNVGPLGVAHGWIGTFFYLWVLERDPWLELFGQG
ncbi:MAG: hypothetical protein JNM84_01435 [Planctomycetes bacterium]|nr:hypothetical protein [Planctomycetota bacterium]